MYVVSLHWLTLALMLQEKYVFTHNSDFCCFLSAEKKSLLSHLNT